MRSSSCVAFTLLLLRPERRPGTGLAVSGWVTGIIVSMLSPSPSASSSSSWAELTLSARVLARVERVAVFGFGLVVESVVGEGSAAAGAERVARARGGIVADVDV